MFNSSKTTLSEPDGIECVNGRLSQSLQLLRVKKSPATAAAQAQIYVSNTGNEETRISDAYPATGTVQGPPGTVLVSNANANSSR